MNKQIKQIMALGLSMLMALGGISYTAKNTKEVQAAQSYQLVWADEFNGTALDTNTWSYEIGNGDWGWGNGEVEYYTNRTKNVEVADGFLQIHALRENYGGQKYTSGRIISKGKKYFKYGKMEARIKVENGNQDGVWPAYWMMGENMSQGVGWPYCGEIDIMEHANSNNYVGGCLHWNTNGLNGSYSHGSYGSGFEGAQNAFGYFTDNTNNGINGWHTYGLIWDENHMEWQLDGVTFLSQDITDNNAYCFQKEHFFLFNLAIGGTGTGFTNYITANEATYQTATMYVDYLRVYQLKEDNNAVQDPTTKQTQVETETKISYETVDAAASHQGTFGYYDDSAGAWTGTPVPKATVLSTANNGISMKIDSIGNKLWGIQAYLKQLEYIAGNTYTYKCTLTSDVTKNVRVKVVGDDDNHIIYQEDITVQAGVPYQFEKEIKIPDDYTANLNLFFGLGKNDEAGENLDPNTSLNFAISDVSFVTEKKIVTVIEKPTATTKNVTTTTVNTENSTVKKPGKAKIKKVVRKKKSLKIKIKKVKRAKGYQIKYSTNKKFKKSKKKITKRLKYTIKKLKSNKKYYIKVRAYVLDSQGKRVYGKFSKVKKVKTK
ncbi:MAG: family 16 glycosylhydrolase [Eubacterium sp.]